MDRLSHWSRFIIDHDIKTIAEIGVWRGDFAIAMLERCPNIERYFLIDPWRKLPDWNKPLNEDNLEEAYLDARTKLQCFQTKCVFLRGRTVDVAGQIPLIDFAYVDGDHTLRGIVTDLLTIWPKIRDGGWIGGDDFCRSIWQHGRRFEPSMVFPFAIHFAEGVDCPITALGGDQFLIEKTSGFSFSDLTEGYPSTAVLAQIPREGLFSGIVRKVSRINS